MKFITLLRCSFPILGVVIRVAASEGLPPAPTSLSLPEFLQLVLARNESLQTKLLEFAINRKRHRAEQGIFEPEFVTSYDRLESVRQNTTEQLLSAGGTSLFAQTNNVYNAGLESLVPTGARIRLGYSLQDLRNNLGGSFGRTNGRSEYVTFVGVTISQPILKNGWPGVTMVNVRLAALASDIAFQDYRRQLMITLSSAEAGYWNLYLAQEQVRFFHESVSVAETVLKDAQAKLTVGKGAELDVLQTEAGLTLRKTKLTEAEQKYAESAAQLRVLISLPAEGSQPDLRAQDAPNMSLDAAPGFEDCGRKALALNPDLLSQRLKVAQENIKLAFANNQRLPQLDIKASYGLNGLGNSLGNSWSKAETWDYPVYTIGLELRIPLGGGIKTRNEYGIANLRKEQALLETKALETLVLNAISTAILKVRHTRNATENNRKLAQFNADVLKSQLARLDVGKVESRKVLEAEADLFEAKNAVVEATVQYARAQLELALAEGVLLEKRQVDWTQSELQERTAKVFRQAGGSPTLYKKLVNDMKSRYTPPAAP